MDRAPAGSETLWDVGDVSQEQFGADGDDLSGMGHKYQTSDRQRRPGGQCRRKYGATAQYFRKGGWFVAVDMQGPAGARALRDQLSDPGGVAGLHPHPLAARQGLRHQSVHVQRRLGSSDVL